MTLPDRPVIRSELDPDPLTAFEEERRDPWEWLHDNDFSWDEVNAIAVVLDAGGFDIVSQERRRLAHHSHLGAIVVVSAVVVLAVIATALLLAGFRP